MSRREFSAKVRVAAWQRSNGRCESGRIAHMPNIGCGRKLFPGDIRFEHVDPDGLTGEPTLDNCAVLCRSCWMIKTTTYDVPAIAKAKRREARHIGARISRNPMPGSKASGLRKRMNGTVERR